MYQLRVIGNMFISKEQVRVTLDKNYYRGLLQLEKFSHVHVFYTREQQEYHLEEQMMKIVTVDKKTGVLELKAKLPVEEVTSCLVFDIKPYFPCEDAVQRSTGSKERQPEVKLTFDEEKKEFELEKIGETVCRNGQRLDSLEELREELNQKIRGGRVDDYATKELKSLRDKIDKTETKMREKADMVMRSHKDCLSDTFSTMRNGHVCIPVKKDCKLKISGTVMDKSSTGSTLFIEPSSVTRHYEELQGLLMEEENEVRQILYTLSAMLADEAEVMENNEHIIEKLDFAFAKGKLSIVYEGIQPTIHTNRIIKLVDGRHPLMDKNVNVPLNFEIGGAVQGIIITGPNTGGKTVAIKTVALNCIMAQSGLHVAAREADICLNNAFLCDIGDGQNIAENLSTFSSHITNVLSILQHADKDSLVIVDELGSGTDPTEGMGIAIAVLEELKKSGALHLVTTHYPEVKNYAQKAEGVINARMAFDRQSLKPLYKLIIGEAGESCAFYIAKELGMPETMLNRASLAAYGEELPEDFGFTDKNKELVHEKNASIQKKKVVKNKQERADQFQLGDSVMVYPDKKIGIVCQRANEKGVLQVQMPDKKIWINHKRIKLHVAASELYPEDYDFSIIFESVDVRKAKHQMARKYVDEPVEISE